MTEAEREAHVSAIIAGLWARWDASDREEPWRGALIPVTVSGYTFHQRYLLTREDVRRLAGHIEEEHRKDGDG